jgi:pimeloyl-ACP methyl ester carboxylesterase
MEQTLLGRGRPGHAGSAGYETGLGLEYVASHPVLSARQRTIAFDNRKAERSEVPPGPYSIVVMASDNAAVLDAAGIDSARVVGPSMGGMIAQEFALQFPARVRLLVLACTARQQP